MVAIGQWNLLVRLNKTSKDQLMHIIIFVDFDFYYTVNLSLWKSFVNMTEIRTLH